MKNSPSGASAELPACALGVPIFRVLPDTGLLELGQLLHHRPVRRGDVIAQAGDPITDLIIVARGRLRAIQTSPSGREQTVRTLGPGDFVGELALFSPAHHASDLIAAGDGQVCLVPRAGIQSLMQRHPEVATALVAALAERLAAAEQRIGDLALRDVGQRLAAELLRLAAAAGGDKTTIALTEAWADLASRLGTTPESISRRLKSLAAAGLIEQPDSRTVVIVDTAELKRLADI